MERFSAELFINALTNSNSILEVEKIISFACKKIRGFSQISQSCFAINGFEIKLSNNNIFVKEREALVIAKDLKIRSSPNIILEKVFPPIAASPNNCLLVTCFEGCFYRPIIPCGFDRPNIPLIARQGLVSDIDILASHGFFHPKAVSDFAHWYLHPDRSVVLIDSWEELRKIETSEVVKLGDTLTALFARYDGDKK
jgi:hypothetical protein